ncbi:cilia- and flagella-associated protein 58-like [Macrobrachium nipponense]|uniref:cilia- and flagella-associated protein 58-like n=1 Tax=Macrobrachium nipponense TaxID=159736 RepID=UPI0030C7D953
MREKLDRLARQNETLEKERKDHLILNQELQVQDEMEWQINKSKDEVGELNKKDIEKKDDNDQLSIEKTVHTPKDKVGCVEKDSKNMGEKSQEQGPSDAAELQRIIDKQADQIQRLRKKVLEMEEERRQCEADFQGWERTAYTVGKENSELKVILEDLSRKKRLFEEGNKDLKEEVKELKRKLDENRMNVMKKEKEIRSTLEEIKNIRRQLTEELTVCNQIRNEKELMALHIKKLECENADYMKDVAYFKEWFEKDYTDHCEDVEICLEKFLEVSDRQQLLLKEKLQIMRKTRDSDEVEVNEWRVSPNSSD